MTGIQYVKHRLRQDFSDRAEELEVLFDRHMKELMEPTNGEMAPYDYQLMFNSFVSPCLACLRAMKDAGMDLKLTERYVEKLSAEFSDDMKNG